MRNQPRLAIVGAGMAGLTTAILSQRYGFDVTIFEQAPRLERLGAGIQLSPDVTRIFGNLELLEKMVAVGVVPRVRYGREGYTGAITFEVPVDRYPEMYGAPHLMIHRGDLQDALLSPTRPGTVKLGKRLRDVADGATGLRLQFARAPRLPKRDDLFPRASGVVRGDRIVQIDRLQEIIDDAVLIDRRLR